MTSMGPLLEVVEQFFIEDEWPYSHQGGVLSTGFKGNNGQYECYAQERADQEQLLFYAYCPIKAPEEKRLVVAEFVTRANYGIVIGNFEMDFEDGEIRYKSSVDMEGEKLTVGMVRSLIYANVFTMDRYFKALMRTIYSNISPEIAISEAENPS